MTLCIGLKKLGMAAKNAAVLAERNRIGQEIHDGLAQGFTGILMQLGAAEEAMRECTRSSPLPAILTRIRDLAKDGLAEARRSVMALRPDQTRRVGLELALKQLAERSTVDGRVACSFEGAHERRASHPSASTNCCASRRRPSAMPCAMRIPARSASCSRRKPSSGGSRSSTTAAA